MDQGGTCSEVGPFFPQTPLYLIQNGVSLRSDILLEPDWVLIGVLVAASLATIIILLVALYLFREYGWAKDLYLIPWYRKLAQKFGFDDYSSKVCSCNFIQFFNPTLFIFLFNFGRVQQFIQSRNSTETLNWLPSNKETIQIWLMTWLRQETSSGITKSK